MIQVVPSASGVTEGDAVNVVLPVAELLLVGASPDVVVAIVVVTGSAFVPVDGAR